MKKRIIVNLILILSMLTVLALFTACNKSPENINKEHIHTSGYTVKANKIPPSCTSEGSYDEVVYCDSCHVEIGRTEGFVIPKLEHTPSEWLIESSPKCDANGLSYKECTVCKARLQENITSMTAHFPGNWIIKKEPTCAAVGEKYRACINCNEIVDTAEIEKNTNHTPGEWITDLEPTCGEGGQRHLECTVCNTTIDTEYISSDIPHTPGEWVTDKYPTCGEDGSKHLDCTVCGTTLQTGTLFKTNSHTGEWLYDDNESVPCNERSYYRNCAVCGVLEERGGNSDDHKFDTVTYPPKCNDRGYDVSTCSSCGFVTEHNYVNSIGHDPEKSYSFDHSYHWYNCTRCDEKIGRSEHSFDSAGICTACSQPRTPSPCITYALSDDGTYAEVVGYDGYVPNYVIAETYMNVPVTVIRDEAFKDLSARSVFIPDSIEHIGNMAFYNCSLQYIMIGKGVRSIGSMAFSNSTFSHSLYDLYITDLMAWCAIDFDGWRANPICRASNIYVDGKLTTELIIPNGVTSISPFTFYSLSSITELVIPDTVISIEDSAFAICTSLKKITIGSNVSRIATGVFSNCYGLEEVHIKDLSKWCRIDFENESSTPFCYASNFYLQGELLTSVIIPSDIISINKYVFSGIKSIESITIPKQVISIDSYAFYDCDGLKSITIPGNVISIGDYAFYDCSSIESVVMGNGLGEIGNMAFYGCAMLKSVTLPATVKEIYPGIFDNCNSALYTNDGVCTYIGDTENPYTLLYKVNDKSIYAYSINGKTKAIAGQAFKDCTSLLTVMLPEGLCNIGSEAFRGCHKLVEVINNSTLEITVGSDDYGYVGNYAIDVHNESSRISIADGYIFYTHETVNQLLDYIGDETELILPANHNGMSYRINSYAFYMRDDITSIIISGTHIEERAFYKCSSLVSVTITDTVAFIGSNAFEGCDNLESIAIEGASSWYITDNRTNWENAVGGQLVDITNDKICATYFKSDYSDKYWYAI